MWYQHKVFKFVHDPNEDASLKTSILRLLVLVILLSLTISTGLIRHTTVPRNTRRHGRTLLSDGISNGFNTKSAAEAIRYMPPRTAEYTGEPGIPFNVTPAMMEKAGLPIRSTIDLNNVTVKYWVFVTAVSVNHFQEGMDCVASIQRHFPERRIYFFDLGDLREGQVDQIKRWCGVTYRKFPFGKYPQHFQTVIQYSWKPFVLKEVLEEHGGAFWVDASVRFKSDNMTSVYDLLLKSGGMAMLKYIYTPHLVYTHKQTFDYLPSNQTRQAESKIQGETNSIMVFKTQKVYSRVLHWWFVCALDQACFAPLPRREANNCSAHVIPSTQCHRFDQSVVMLLNLNHYGYDLQQFVMNNELRSKLLGIRRGSKLLDAPVVCFRKIKGT